MDLIPDPTAFGPLFQEKLESQFPILIEKTAI